MLVQPPLWSVTIPSLITASVMTVSFMPQPISVSFPYNFFLTGLHFQCQAWMQCDKLQLKRRQDRNDCHHSIWLNCYLKFFQNSSLFHCLIPNAPQTLIYAFVLSQYAHINYCNSLLARCHQKLICKLQKFENNTAYLICRSSGLDSISLIPLLYTGFLSNPMFNPKFFLPLSH